MHDCTKHLEKEQYVYDAKILKVKCMTILYAWYFKQFNLHFLLLWSKMYQQVFKVLIVRLYVVWHLSSNGRDHKDYHLLACDTM